MKRSYAILDLQFGSTGKGLLAGYLARQRKPDGVVCAFGPNAGHTFVDGLGRRFIHVMMPMGALSPNIKTVFFGPGSVIEPDILMKEYDVLWHLGYRFEMAIHENATVVQRRHLSQEAEYGAKIGSTQKGVGAALAEKIRRNVHVGEHIIAREVLRKMPLEAFVVGVPEYNDLMDKVERLQIEGAQGFSLSIHHGFYPYTTSRDCTMASLLSDCAVPLNRGEVLSFGVARTFPIRVNNKTGSSGPGYHDQEEMTWEQIGVAPELTTVTKLPRRVFSFSMEQIKQAMRMNCTDSLFLNFCNYMPPDKVASLAARIKEETGVGVGWYGYGPKETDVEEVT